MTSDSTGMQGVARLEPPWPPGDGPPPDDEVEAARDLGHANSEAEVGLLGALLTNNAAYERVADILEPEHFVDPAHQAIYEAIATFIEDGRQADPRTLKPYFENDPALKDRGGWKYLVTLVTAVMAIVNAEDYARTIFDCWRRRCLDRTLARAGNALYRLQLGRESGEIIAEIEADLAKLESKGQRGETLPEDIAFGVDRFLDQADAALKAGGQLVGVTTGLAGLDAVTGGLHGSDLLILAGRPAMGKTALALNIARASAEAVVEWRRKTEQGDLEAAKRPRGRVLFFSLEMDDGQLAGRLLAERTGISTDKVRRGEIDSDDVRRLVAAGGWLKGLPLTIDKTGGISVAQMRSRARRIAKREGLVLVVVDYLQLVRGEGRDRVEIVSNITRELKAMAKELRVPVLALSQLSRALEARDDKRPMLSDLRESGSIEQDADIVLFLYRDEYYRSKEEPRRKTGQTDERYNDLVADWQSELEKVKGIAEIILAKNRHGPEATVKSRFSGARQRFSDIDTGASRQPEIPGLPEEY